MKSIGTRYFFLAPLVVLATVACAKRDNDFAARLTKAKAEAAEKTGKIADDKAAPSRFTKTTPDVNKGDAKLVLSESCENPIKMEAQKEETEVSLEELSSADRKPLVLKSTELFTEIQNKDQSQNQTQNEDKNQDKELKITMQVHATGSDFALPEAFKSPATAADKVIVVCHTGKDTPEAKAETQANEKIEGLLRLPVEVLADGAVKVLREDKVEIEKGEIKTNSTLYEAAQNLKEMAKSENLQLVALKQANGDIVIKMKISTTDKESGKTTTQWMSGTYTVKK